jgi:tRNA-binding protein
MTTQIEWSDFERVDMRVGTVLRAEPFPEARKPAYKLWIDLGPLGERRSSARITDRYRVDELVGRQVICVVNFPPKRIGPFVSEVLVLGAYVDGGAVVLLRPDQDVERGSRIG